MRYRTDYSAQSLSSEPDILFLDGWQLRYQAFAARADDPRPPVLLLGGAFQSFRSFTGEVSELLAEHPVILLDLPSQGGNLQLAAELSLEDLADLIAAFAEQLGLPPLMPIGLSYGSALAALFAARHPRRCARLLLAGITAFGRPGARLLLEEALARLDEGDQSAFAHGVLTGLINPLQLERTGVSPVFRKAMLRQLQRLTAAEIERYRQNSRRLLAFGGFERHPTCPTLVLAGEYDHFTQPWEHAVFAHACGNAEFALIHDADHLAQFERREACARLYGPFLRGEALPERAEGSTRIPRTRLLDLERRFEVRHRPAQGHARLEHPQFGVYAAELMELGYFGGRLHAELPESRPQRGWRLCCDGLADSGEGRLDFRGIAVMQRIASPRQPPDDPHSPADLPVTRVLAEIGIEVGQVGALGEAFKFGRQATPEGLDHRALEIVHQPLGDHHQRALAIEPGEQRGKAALAVLGEDIHSRHRVLRAQPTLLAEQRRLARGHRRQVGLQVAQLWIALPEASPTRREPAGHFHHLDHSLAFDGLGQARVDHEVSL